MVTAEQLRIFAERGYIVLSGVVPSDALEMARAEIARTVSADPPSSDHVGPCSYWPAIDDVHPFTGLLASDRALTAAEALVRPHRIDRPDMAQIALNIPPFPHRPGGPHIDGLTPPEPDGRPGTFTMLAGIMLTDQPGDDLGNLWVWPGTHLTAAAYFRTHGADALLTAIPYPPVDLPEPQQVHAQAGDLLLAHYLLAHNIGGNTGPQTRECIYYRLRAHGHRGRWRTVVQDSLLEFPAVRQREPADLG